jgi:hypothetical protein
MLLFHSKTFVPVSHLSMHFPRNTRCCVGGAAAPQIVLFLHCCANRSENGVKKTGRKNYFSREKIILKNGRKRQNPPKTRPVPRFRERRPRRRAAGRGMQDSVLHRVAFSFLKKSPKRKPETAFPVLSLPCREPWPFVVIAVRIARTRIASAPISRSAR